MGNKPSSLLQDEEICTISEETGFSETQIEHLYSRFVSLDQSGICAGLSRQDFLRVPELAINPLSDRIMQMFFSKCDEEHDRINFRQFMEVLATFRHSRPCRTKNPAEPAINGRRKKLHFMFKIYDVDDDNLLNLEDLVTIVKMMVGNYVSDSVVSRIAERSLHELDKNCDGFIDFEEFCSGFTRQDIDEALKVKFN